MGGRGSHGGESRVVDGVGGGAAGGVYLFGDPEEGF